MNSNTYDLFDQLIMNEQLNTADIVNRICEETESTDFIDADDYKWMISVSEEQKRYKNPIKMFEEKGV